MKHPTLIRRRTWLAGMAGVVIAPRIKIGRYCEIGVPGLYRSDLAPRTVIDPRYDEPLIVQYVEYLGDVITLDFGETLVDNRPVTQIAPSRSVRRTTACSSS